MSESTTSSAGTTSATGTTTATTAAATPDGTCRAVYGDTNNPNGRIDVYVGGEWKTLSGITKINFLTAAFTTPGETVLNASFGDISIVPASQAVIG